MTPSTTTKRGKGEHVFIEHAISSAETLKKQSLIQKMKSISTKFDADGDEQSFFMADMGELYRQYLRWNRNLENVEPFYAVKSNPDAGVLRLLAALGTGFDCASRGEIESVLDLGVEPSRIIYAHPCKPNSHIRYARKEGVSKMTFDSIDELYKIKAIFPEAELILRILTDDSSSHCRFQNKFGAPSSYVSELFQKAKKLALNIVGVSFHIGSGATDPQLFIKAVRDSRAAFNKAREFGYLLKILDVGGGFSDESFEAMSQALTKALDDEFPCDVHFIGEPGRYFVSSAFTLACNIIARRDIRKEGGDISYMLFLSDGVYGSFMDNVLYDEHREPRVLVSTSHETSAVALGYSLWGPTCDGLDRITERAFFQELLNVGDWLYFEEMGAYTTCLSTNFNGFSNKAKVIYVSSEPETTALFQLLAKE